MRNQGDFDPRLDSTVRTHANKLRARLTGYYESEGRNDEILITLPKGHYIPIVALRSRHFWRRPVLAAALALLTLCFVLRPSQAPPTKPISAPAAPGRLLVRATSEGAHPKRIPLKYVPNYLAISPAGDKVFAINNYGEILSIVGTGNGTVRTFHLGRQGGAMAVAPDGKLYIGSFVEGITVFDIDRERVLGTLATGGPVRGMTIDPTGKNLFLAMGELGFRELGLEGQTVSAPWNEVNSPIEVAIDHAGQRLFVAYQGSGPSGSRTRFGGDFQCCKKAENRVGHGSADGRRASRRVP